LYTSSKILVVDDDMDTIDLLRLTLQRKGFRIITATSWDEVMDRIVMAEREKDPIHAIILDIMMPSRSGFEMMLSLKVVLKPMPPVIFLSAKCTIDDMVKASDLGAVKYLVKPTTPDKLLEALESALGKRA
jgi:two-component system, OmpR family, response regulator